MIARTKLEAAIAELERLRNESDADPLHARWSIGSTGPTGCDLMSTYGDESPEIIAMGLYVSDANLMVTLHRTIDAQLAFLRSNIEAVTEGSSADEPWAAQQALQLAVAILGEVTS